eukprot:Platyproteum_vivax@DN1938_c0_g1_i1.p1
MHLLFLILLSVAIVTVSGSASKRSGRWTFREDMPRAKSDHTCHTVGDSIVCLGGCQSDQVCPESGDDCYCLVLSRATEIYDAHKDKWLLGKNMPRKRSRHCAAAVKKKIYVFGGRTINDKVVPQVDVYDVAADNWLTLPENSNMATPPSDCGAAAMSNGQIVITGGWMEDYSGSRDETVYFDTSNLKWSDGPSLNVGRGDLAVEAVGNAVFAFGGFNQTICDVTDELEALKMSPSKFMTKTDPLADDGWKMMEPLGVKRADKGSAIAENALFVVGGEVKVPGNECKLSRTVGDVESYDPATNEWTSRLPMPLPRMRFACAGWKDNILCFGGQGDFKAGGRVHPTSTIVQMYRPCSNKVKDFDETGVDCGGSCAPCSDGAYQIRLGGFLLLYALMFNF